MALSVGTLSTSPSTTSTKTTTTAGMPTSTMQSLLSPSSTQAVTSPFQPAVQINGLVSGLDTASIVQKLVSLQQAPITLIQNKITADNNQLSAWSTFKTSLQSLETAANSLSTPTSFLGTKGSFTNSIPTDPSIVTVSTTGNVASGSYSFTVNNLAQQQKMLSDQTFSSLTQILPINGVTITTAAGQTKTFTGQTPGDLQAEINNAGMGITATMVNTSNSSATPAYQMQLASSGTGTSSGFTVSVTPGTSFNPNPTILNFTTTQAAHDASITIDGMTVSRPTNNFNDIIQGVNMTVTAQGTGTLNFAADISTTTNNINNFITSYNSVLSFIQTQTTYNSASKTQQPLFSNSSLLNIQQTLSGIFSGFSTGLGRTSNAYSTLGQVGITTDPNTFQLNVDTTQVSQALAANITAVRNLFTGGASGAYSFVHNTGGAAAGVYDTRWMNGQLQMSLRGTNNWITMTNSGGNYFDGPKGTILEGLAIYADPSTQVEGFQGTETVWSGAALQVAFQTANYTISATGAPIYDETQSLNQANQTYQNEIDAMNKRIQKLSTDLNSKYTKMETTLAKLQGQSNYLTQQLSYLPNMSTNMPRGTKL